MDVTNHEAQDKSKSVAKILQHLELLRQMKADGATPEKALNACNEAMDTYAPLAEEIGMTREQKEMLDLAVELGYPEDYRKLKQLLFESEAMCENVFQAFALPIRSVLDSLGIEYSFKYRMKSVYSIWRKMRVDHKEFDDVYDLFASRIVYKTPDHVLPLSEPSDLEQLDEVQRVKADTLAGIDRERLTCWRIFTVISSLYRIHPNRIKDWVTHPKASGYRALQLTVMGPDCNWIEIQVRSERMDYEAEYGAANHALYKKETAVR